MIGERRLDLGQTGLSVSTGWDPLAVDHRPHFLEAMSAPTHELKNAEDLGEILDRPARTAVVVMTHHFERDKALVRETVERRPLYVGLLGSRSRSEKLISELSETTISTCPGSTHRLDSRSVPRRSRRSRSRSLWRSRR